MLTLALISDNGYTSKEKSLIPENIQNKIQRNYGNRNQRRIQYAEIGVGNNFDYSFKQFFHNGIYY